MTVLMRPEGSMDGYTEIAYLTSGLLISKLGDDGYYRIQDRNDVVYVSQAAIDQILEHFGKNKCSHKEYKNGHCAEMTCHNYVEKHRGE